MVGHEAERHHHQVAHAVGRGQPNLLVERRPEPGTGPGAGRLIALAPLTRRHAGRLRNRRRRGAQLLRIGIAAGDPGFRQAVRREQHPDAGGAWRCPRCRGQPAQRGAQFARHGGGKARVVAELGNEGEPRRCRGVTDGRLHLFPIGADAVPRVVRRQGQPYRAGHAALGQVLHRRGNTRLPVAHAHLHVGGNSAGAEGAAQSLRLPFGDLPQWRLAADPAVPFADLLHQRRRGRAPAADVEQVGLHVGQRGGSAVGHHQHAEPAHRAATGAALPAAAVG